jgi:hypothetical protein
VLEGVQKGQRRFRTGGEPDAVQVGRDVNHRPLPRQNGDPPGARAIRAR